MRPLRKNRGGAFIRLLALIFVGFLLISWLPRCTQQLGQMAGNAASHAASGAASSAGNSLSNWGHQLLHRLASLVSGVRDQWTYADPAERFNLVCEHVPVEGVDKLCPYFTSAVKGASDAQTARIACYWHAAATGPNAQQTLQLINKVCPQTASDPSRLQTCLAQYVEPGDASSCLASSPEQLWSELHTMIEPIACPPGTPKSWCTTQSSSQSASSSTSSSASTNGVPNTSPRTDLNYLNCLTHYYTYLRPWGQTSCGSTITTDSAACARTALLNFTYQGQSVGAGQVAQCDGLQQ